jgi:hypothetical protein
MKSGTTFIQHGILAKLDELTAAGWCYPMQFAPARGAINHERATYGLVGTEIPWVDQATQLQMQPQWQKLKAEIDQTNLPILLSAEALAVMLEPGIKLLLSQLPKREIKIVITARDLARVMPSSWQQSVRNGRTYSYDEYFDRIKRAKELPLTESVGSNFWRSYELSEVVARWSKFVPLENISIVTVPRKQGADSLWSRFISATGLPLTKSEPIFDDKRAHTAISWPEAEVLNELNQKWQQEKRPTKLRNQLRRRIVQEGFQQRSDRGRSIGLTAPWLELAKSWADADVAKLLTANVQIFGDASDLRVDPQLAAVSPCEAAEIEQARAIAARFHDRMRLQAVAKLFGITRKPR